ncbi:hypothetical protein FH972_010055 [Carpinus fangiana]|uniref:DEAD-box ATP-dependent RNA helicase 41 n=1 Tax=Carpinus fangiana TaxID=176857 RepID=A0A660KPV7_9ROSI|nr:hypothetical protein FH972_010055 [Carpinus fangiana]
MEDGNKVNQCKSEMLSTDGDVSTVLDVADKIKERCWEQREALPGEPKCIICRRYGEYICDETDDDVCSLECKQALLRRVANSQLPVGLPPPKKLPATDECFYVRDSDDKSGSLSLTMDQTESLRRKLEIHVKGELAVAPMLSFSSCNLPQKLLQNIEAAGYDVPTPADKLGNVYNLWSGELRGLYTGNIVVAFGPHNQSQRNIMWMGTQSVGECSSSTSLSSQQDVEDDQMIAVVLSEEYAKLDGAVARRLANLAPVPHVPRINSYIPNLSDASLDHQFQSSVLLNVYGLYEVNVSGDGNCPDMCNSPEFRALSDQIYKSAEYHKHVRKEIVQQVEWI